MLNVNTIMTSLKLIFPCKKLRRSPRLEIREKFVSKTKCIEDGPLGYLEVLPLELKFILLSYLPVDDLSILTITSKVTRNLVELYRSTSRGQQHLLPCVPPHCVIQPAEQQNHLLHFKKLGLLLKRSTCLYATKERLKVIQQCIHKYVCSLHKSCEDAKKCIGLKCYGCFLHTIISGWDDKECIKAFHTIGHGTLMLRHLDSIVNCKAGAYPSLELHVRLFFRRVFLNTMKSDFDRSFWLTLILKPFPMVHQAKILLLLFGPVSDGEVQWYEMCETTPTSREMSERYFSQLADAFRILHFCSKAWTEDDVISVMDEITSCPDEWLAESVANLLFLCGDVIALKVLTSKAVNGRITELATILTSLCVVCSRHGHPLSWVIQVLIEVCQVMDSCKDRLGLLHAIIDNFREVVMDIHEYGDPDDDSIQEMQMMLDAQSDFTKKVIQLALRNNFAALQRET